MSTTKSNNDNQNNYESTDMGNMNRFVDQYKDSIKSTGTPSSWFVWDGIRWKYCKDNTHATQKAYETIKNIENRVRSAAHQKWYRATKNAARSAKCTKEVPKSEKQCQHGSNRPNKLWVGGMVRGTAGLLSKHVKTAFTAAYKTH